VSEELSRQPALVIMARAPERGRVKTRLAQEIGEDETLRVYRNLLDITYAAVASWLGKVTVYSTGNESAWCGTSVGIFPRQQQSPGGLGNRLRTAIQEQFKNGASSVIVIGSDCPGITRNHLREIADLLQRFPIAFGPAHDGGYWALGIGQPAVVPVCCDDTLPWSSSMLLDESLIRAQSAGFSVGFGPRLRDVDDLESLEYSRGTGYPI